ncbi:MAG: hypothetical protein ACLGGX_11905, partial [Bdellovibrionia bacterium]
MRVLKLIVSILFLPWLALAGPAQLSYQGRILRSDGRAFENNNVSFIFEILSADETCVMYREQRNSINMSGSGGVFDLTIGTGTKLFPASGDLHSIFLNSGSKQCANSDNTVAGTTTVTANTGRKLRVAFWDGSSWKMISPNSSINSVPFASYAKSSEMIGTITAGEIAVLDTPGVDCASGEVLTYESGKLKCVPDAGGAGTITSIIAGAGITTSGTTNVTVAVDVGTGANQILQLNGSGALPAVSGVNLTNLNASNLSSGTVPMARLSVGTAAGTLAAGDDSRFTDARTPTGTAGGDLNGTYPNPTVDGI